MKKRLFKLIISNVFILSLYMSSLITVVFPILELTNSPSHVTVLCYHHIIDKPLSLFPDTKAIITKEEFESQMKYLFENDYHTASLSEIEEYLYNKMPLPEKTVLITFDDGYESVYKIAYPILKKYGFKAVVFLIGSCIQKDENSKVTTKFKHLNVKQILEMQKSGVFEFGSHTFNMHRLVDKKSILTLSSKEEIAKDFEELNRVFEEIGLPKPRAIAFPYGHYNKIALEISKKYYKLGFTVNLKDGTIYKSSDPFLLKRIIVPPNTSKEIFSAMLKGSIKNINIIPRYPNVARLIINEKEQIKSYIIESFSKGNANFVAAKAFFAPLGVETIWDTQNKSIILKKGDNTLNIYHPDGFAVLNGSPLNHKINLIVKNGKAYIIPETATKYLGINLKKNNLEKAFFYYKE